MVLRAPDVDAEKAAHGFAGAFPIPIGPQTAGCVLRLPNVGDRVRRVAGPVPLDARQVERRLDGQIPLEQMNDLPRFIVASAAVRSRSSSRSFRTASATSMRSSSSDVSM